MAKSILICGYGTGISAALAERFGAEGFSVALVARNAERLQAGVAVLESKGIRAAAFPADLGDPAAVKALVESARQKLGPITVLQWNAYATGAGDLAQSDPVEIRRVLDVAVTGLMTAVQAVLPDLRKEKDAAVLVTNGGLGMFDQKVDAMAVAWGAAGLAIANSAKHKLVGLLSEKLKGDNVYVGQVMVLLPVKGTVWDDGTATLEPATVAAKFWELYSARAAVSATVG